MCNHVMHRLDRADASRCFYPKIWAYDLSHKGNIFGSSSARRKAGRRLHEVGPSPLGDDRSNRYLRRRQQRRFENDLDGDRSLSSITRIAGGRDHGPNVRLGISIPATLEGAERDDHV